MKVVALVSGGKDSCFSMMECERYGHEIIAIANLRPEEPQRELDSFMFQSVATNVVDLIAEAMDLPLIKGYILGKPKTQELQYAVTEGDEVEDLFKLLQQVKIQFPQVEAVCTGAIFSNYQRTRVENVCRRLNLFSLAYLWRREQAPLLQEMVDSGIDARLVKVASMGLSPHKHLGKSIGQLSPYFHSLYDKYQFHVCGEGGEYETLTLDCPLFRQSIVIDKSSIEIHSDDMFAPVGLFQIQECHLQEKPGISKKRSSPIVAEAAKVSTAATSTDVEPSELVECCAMGGVKTYRNQVYFSGLQAPTANTLEAEVRSVFESLITMLKAMDMTLADVLFVHLYINDVAQFGQINAVYCQYFGESPASRSCVQAALKDSRILVDCVAEKGTGLAKFNNLTKREVLHVQSISTWAPTCIGPYSQANIMRRALIFLAGQIALVPETMVLVEGGLMVQAQLAFKNIRCVLDSLESDLHHVLGGVVYLSSDINASVLQELDAFCRERIVGNDGKDSAFEHEDDSDESDDEEDKDAVILGLARRVPLVHVVVEKLPRNAAIEPELIALTHRAKKFLDVRTTRTEKESGGETNNVQHSFIPRIISNALVTLGQKPEGNDHPTAYRAILLSIARSLEEACMTPSQLMHFRVFYKPEEVGDIEVFQRELKAEVEAIFGPHADTPALTFIAARAIYPNAWLGIHALAVDFDKMETELWLRKQL